MIVQEIKTHKQVVIDIANGLEQIEVYRGSFAEIPTRLLTREILHKSELADRIRLTVKTANRR